MTVQIFIPSNRFILFFYFFVFNIFIEVRLIYNVVLISAVQQSDSVTHILRSILFSDSFPLWAISEYCVEFGSFFKKF